MFFAKAYYTVLYIFGNVTGIIHRYIILGGIFTYNDIYYWFSFYRDYTSGINFIWLFVGYVIRWAYYTVLYTIDIVTGIIHSYVVLGDLSPGWARPSLSSARSSRPTPLSLPSSCWCGPLSFSCWIAPWLGFFGC